MKKRNIWRKLIEFRKELEMILIVFKEVIVLRIGVSEYYGKYFRKLKMGKFFKKNKFGRKVKFDMDVYI